MLVGIPCETKNCLRGLARRKACHKINLYGGFSHFCGAGGASRRALQQMKKQVDIREEGYCRSCTLNVQIGSRWSGGDR